MRPRSMGIEDLDLSNYHLLGPEERLHFSEPAPGSLAPPPAHIPQDPSVAPNSEASQCDLCDLTVWLIKDSPMAKVEHTALIAFGNVFGLAGALIGEIVIGPMQLGGFKLHTGPYGSEDPWGLFGVVQRAFNDAYRETWDLPIPDRNAEYIQNLYREPDLFLPNSVGMQNPGYADPG